MYVVARSKVNDRIEAWIDSYADSKPYFRLYPEATGDYK